MADRAVSAVFGYVLTLGITTLVISGLFVTAGGYVDGQHDRAIRAEFEVVGNRVAADIAAVDRLALATGSGGEARMGVELPQRAAGQPYQLKTSPVAGTDTVYQLTLATVGTTADVTVDVHVKSETRLANSTVTGGDLAVVYNGTALEVRNA